jgi:hypothetical protein
VQSSDTLTAQVIVVTKPKLMEELLLLMAVVLVPVTSQEVSLPPVVLAVLAVVLAWVSAVAEGTVATCHTRAE